MTLEELQVLHKAVKARNESRRVASKVEFYRAYLAREYARAASLTDAELEAVLASPAAARQYCQFMDTMRKISAILDSITPATSAAACEQLRVLSNPNVSA